MRVVNPIIVAQNGAQVSAATARAGAPRVGSATTARSSDGFRAALDAATGGATRQSAQTFATGAERAQPDTIVSQVFDPTQELTAADTAELYRVVRAAAKNAAASAEEFEAPETPSVPPQVASRAARRYAQSYFSVGGTFAARGDALEVST
jgi:hypothetical protein